MRPELEEKVEEALKTIETAVNRYDNIAVACSFGKDSMATVDLVKRVDPCIDIFSVATVYMPEVTYEYMNDVSKELEINSNIYLVAEGEDVPTELEDMNVNLLSTEDFRAAQREAKEERGAPLYEVDPDKCCKLLKVEPTQKAVSDLDAWISGLRNTESSTREENETFEDRGVIKVNPILDFTEEDVFNYLEDNDIPLHPWYEKEFPCGKKYRSLGCEPCTEPVEVSEPERAGRWKGVDKTECGIHTSCFECDKGEEEY